MKIELKRAMNTPDAAPSPNPQPLFSGGGDVDYLCPACGFEMLSKVRENSVVNGTLACPKCGTSSQAPVKP